MKLQTNSVGKSNKRFSKTFKSFGFALAIAFASNYVSSAAYAGGESGPGATTGFAAYAPSVPEGLYWVSVATTGVRSTKPSLEVDAYNGTLSWQTPWSIFGAKIAVYGTAIPTAVIQGGVSHADQYNPFLGAAFVWPISENLGFGVSSNFYPPVKTSVGFNFTTYEQRFGVSYVGDDLNLTANFIFGFPSRDLNTNQFVLPNYMITDLTAMKRFGKFEAGIVAYGSSDLSSPFSGYKRNSQIGIGPAIGYSFPDIFVQLKATGDILQKNYGGSDKRIWLNVVVPLYLTAAK